MLLTDELKGLFGRNEYVRLFQDVDAIGYGELWEREIDAALDQCSFLIPILTPDFLQREWCCKEVTRFMAREAALGGRSLIFPICYIDVSHVKPARPAEVYDRTVWDRLRDAAILPFEHYRFADPRRTSSIRRKLSTLARNIRDQLQRPPVSPPLSSPKPAILRGTPMPEMVPIPTGRFRMGVTRRESLRERISGISDARPVHPVTIVRPFLLAKYPVTRGQYAAFVAATGYDEDAGQWRDPGFHQTDEHPVVCVNHADATAYTAWLSARTGEGCCLPSEAQWEYAVPSSRSSQTRDHLPYGRGASLAGVR